MKNAVWAWVTIGMMGLGTAAAAANAAKLERAAAERASVQRVKRPRPSKPPAVVHEAVTEIEESIPAVQPARVKPAPRNTVDTRQLSRASRRQA